MTTSIPTKKPQPAPTPSGYYSILKKKRFYSHLRNPENLKEQHPIPTPPKNIHNSPQKSLQLAKINIYDQSQSDRLQSLGLTIEPRMCLSFRFRDGAESFRMKTEKVEMGDRGRDRERGRSLEFECKSSKKIVYMRKKNNKSLLNRISNAQKISELNITRKTLDSRPMSAHNNNFWTLTQKFKPKKPKSVAIPPKSPRLKKKMSILSPW